MTDLLDLIDEKNATLALISNDPIHARDRQAIIDAIAASVRPDGLVNCNDWRPNIPTWVHHKLIGATVNSLCANGVLIATDRYETSTDRRGRNSGRPMRVYRWAGIRTEENA